MFDTHERPSAKSGLLNARLRGRDAETILRAALQEFPGRIAAVSSFGAESAVLLDLISQIDPATPVLFLDTGKHFAETLAYRDELVARLGLTDVRDIRPDPDEVAREDPDGTLNERDTDACCALRKTRPLEKALAGFDAWLTGRKRFQTSTRLTLPVAEADIDGRIKINPLADWGQDEVDQHFAERALPHHPLVAQGFLSIGCWPCTTPVSAGEDPRAGRWRGSDKTECGIHITPDGRVMRVAAE